MYLNNSGWLIPDIVRWASCFVFMAFLSINKIQKLKNNQIIIKTNEKLNFRTSMNIYEINVEAGKHWK